MGEGYHRAAAGWHPVRATPGAPRPLLRRRVRGCSDGVNPHARVSVGVAGCVSASSSSHHTSTLRSARFTSGASSGFGAT